MSSFAAEQVEKAFQKQDQMAVVANKQQRTSTRKRFWKQIGLGFKTPKEAIVGNYVDKKCPFTSNVSIRGRILRGVVKSTKMKRTIVVRRDYLHYVKKYNRYEKRHTNIPAHVSPCFAVHEGDEVTIGQCRPLSKTVRFNVIRVDATSSKAANKGFKKF